MLRRIPGALEGVEDRRTFGDDLLVGETDAGVVRVVIGEVVEDFFESVGVSGRKIAESARGVGGTLTRFMGGQGREWSGTREIVFQTLARLATDGGPRCGRGRRGCDGWDWWD